MLALRWAILLLLLGAGACFAFYAATGQVRYRKWGLVVLKWTLLAAFGFFAVLIVDRLA
ncbi:MAG: hypothetical protein AVDCRST_MAG51-2299 [uncultured Ramlibacter sp.]|uniref:Transmembrane protein n=1 Tax=uncultured Ramlibacter sp. TaxID=260755 RepID=A0A6J4PT45_9BURK|nr:MAG: hypothetical protein AVDCRST_MAG51-2299 [uncultured Ramlibacter sp.]